MKCQKCDNRAESQLGLCASCDSAFRQQAAEAARRLRENPDDPTASREAQKLIGRSIRWTLKAELESVGLTRENLERIDRLCGPQPKPQQQQEQPAEGGILGDIE